MTLDEELLDAFAELVNIGIGKAANSLNEMVEKRIKIEVPRIESVKSSELKSVMGNQSLNKVSITIKFDGELNGKSILIFDPESAKELVTELTGEEQTDDIDFLSEGTLSEVGNILINSVIGAITNILQVTLGFSVPDFISGDIEKIVSPNNNEEYELLLAHSSISIEEKSFIRADVVILFEVKSYETLINSLQKLVA